MADDGGRTLPAILGDHFEGPPAGPRGRLSPPPTDHSADATESGKNRFQLWLGATQRVLAAQLDPATSDFSAAESRCSVHSKQRHAIPGRTYGKFLGRRRNVAQSEGWSFSLVESEREFLTARRLLCAFPLYCGVSFRRLSSATAAKGRRHLESRRLKYDAAKHRGRPRKLRADRR